MNLLFLTSKVTPELQRLFIAAEKIGVTYAHLLAEYVQLQLPQQRISSAIHNQFDKYDAVITRMANTQDEMYGIQLRENLLHVNSDFESKMLNGKSYKKYPVLSKLLQLVVLDRHNIPIPATHFSRSYENIKLPTVIKALQGCNGQQVHYAQTREEFQHFANLYGRGQFIVQEPLPIGEDYRVIILGGKVIAMHKKISTTGFATNVSAGGKVIPAEPEREAEIGLIATAAAAAFDCEYAGVDVMYNSDKQPVILEVNRAAGFNDAQEEIWGLNLAEHLTTYLRDRAIK